MTCHREADLSLLLDGRLPAGRRAELLREIESCPDCASLWREMQAARDMAIDLPPPARVSGEFRRSLQERIRSGEQPPATAFPVRRTTWTTRLGYAIGGAAAAATVLIAMRGFGSEHPLEPSTSRDLATASLSTDINDPVTDAPPAGPASSTSVANRPVSDQPARTGALQPKSTVDSVGTHSPITTTREPIGQPAAFPVASPGIMPVLRWTPEQVARSVPQETARVWIAFKNEIRRLDNLAASDSWPRIERMASDVRSSVAAVQWLDGRRALYLSQPVRDEIVKVQDALDQLFTTQEAIQRRAALARLSEARLEQLRQQGGYYIACCKPDREFQLDLADLIARDREAVEHLLPRAVVESVYGWLPPNRRMHAIAIQIGSAEYGMVAVPNALLGSFDLGYSRVFVLAPQTGPGQLSTTARDRQPESDATAGRSAPGRLRRKR